MLGFLLNLFASSNVPKRQVSNMQLYYYATCPYCRLVMKQIKVLNLDIEHRNIHQHKAWKQELIENEGKKTVPCLRIEEGTGNVRWMYESLDIAAFLRREFG